MVAKNSDSEIQRKVEDKVLEILRSEASHYFNDVPDQLLALDLDKTKISLSNGSSVEVDGYCDNGAKGLMVEVYARIGKCKPTQVNKLLTDSLKMMMVAKHNPGIAYSKVIAMIDVDTVKHLDSSRSWKALAIKALGVKLLHVKIEDSSLIKSLEKAQKAQYR